MIPIKTGFQLAQQGAERAANKANKEVPGWTEMASAAFCKYALTHEEFTTEDVRLGSPEVPVTSNKKSWGVVARNAAREGICMMTDRVARAKLPQSHKRPLFVWKSLICQAVAA